MFLRLYKTVGRTDELFKIIYGGMDNDPEMDKDMIANLKKLSYFDMNKLKNITNSYDMIKTGGKGFGSLFKVFGRAGKKGSRGAKKTGRSSRGAKKAGRSSRGAKKTSRGSRKSSRRKSKQKKNRKQKKKEKQDDDDKSESYEDEETEYDDEESESYDDEDNESYEDEEESEYDEYDEELKKLNILKTNIEIEKNKLKEIRDSREQINKKINENIKTVLKKVGVDDNNVTTIVEHIDRLNKKFFDISN